MRVLELFSGTRSVGKVCDGLGWESVSVDMILPADHACDIMDFDYMQYPKDHFDIVWASPPCTNYSQLKKCWYGRKLKDGTIYSKEQNVIDQNEADKLVLKSFEIIEYFKPHYWFLENPQTGNLKNRDIMLGRHFYDVDYCMYSDWGYKKRTRIWTNREDFTPLTCDGSGSCGNMVGGSKQHIQVLANGYEMIDGKKVLCNTKKKRDTLRKHRVNMSKSVGCGSQHNQPKDLKYLGQGTNRIDRYRVPSDLIFSLFQL
tara:strand:+ start:1498 stop:2271 length:774 start_codon:yes stop_codon:yes gene_type:complete